MTIQPSSQITEIEKKLAVAYWLIRRLVDTSDGSEYADEAREIIGYPFPRQPWLGFERVAELEKRDLAEDEEMRLLARSLSDA